MFFRTTESNERIGWDLCLSSCIPHTPLLLPYTIALLLVLFIPNALADCVVGILGTILDASRAEPLAAILGTALDPPDDVFALLQQARRIAACLGGLPLLGHLVTVAVSTPLLLA